MKIYLGTDHGGFELKEKVRVYLEDEGYEVKDCGAFEHNADDDYPDFIQPVAQYVQEDPEGVGIIFGRSGQGEAIAANRFIGVRAAVYYGFDDEVVRKSREHNDANILSLGADYLTEEEAKRVITMWLETEFLGEEKYEHRIQKTDEL